MALFKYGLIFAVLTLLTGCITTRQDQGEQYYLLTEMEPITNDEPVIKGTITELVSGDPVLFGTVALYQEDKLIAGTETDFDGRYSFDLPHVTDTIYLVLECTYLGMKKVRITDLMLRSATLVQLDIQLEQEQKLLDGLYCPIDWGVPLIEQDNTTSGQTFTSEQIRRSGVRSN